MGYRTVAVDSFVEKQMRYVTACPGTNCAIAPIVTRRTAAGQLLIIAHQVSTDIMSFAKVYFHLEEKMRVWFSPQ